MKQSGWGRIVNISSLAALGFPTRTSYATAKAGLIFRLVMRLVLDIS